MTPQDRSPHTPDHNPPAAVQGGEVIAEADRLLYQMRCRADRGAYVVGRYLAIGLDPHWYDDHQTLDLLLTCYAFGHRHVAWHGRPVVVYPEGGPPVTHLRWLNAQGHVVFPHLLPGIYRLSIPLCYGGSTEPLTDFIRPRVLAGATEEPAGFTPGRVYPSEDGRAHATVYATAHGTVVVAIETRDQQLAQRRWGFRFARDDGTELFSNEIVLEPVPAEPGLWEGSCERDWVFTEPYNFHFYVLPDDAGDRP